MEFEFDPIKSERCLAERGFDFYYAIRVFDGPTVEFMDNRHRYGEQRMIAIGRIDANLYTLVYTDRRDVRRIISAHRSSRQERKLWPSSE